MRLHRFLKTKGLNEEQIERIIDDLDVQFFKKNCLSTEEYVDTIIDLSDFSTKLNVPLDKLFDALKAKKLQNDLLIDEIERL